MRVGILHRGEFHHHGVRVITTSPPMMRRTVDTATGTRQVRFTPTTRPTRTSRVTVPTTTTTTTVPTISKSVETEIAHERGMAAKERQAAVAAAEARAYEAGKKKGMTVKRTVVEPFIEKTAAREKAQARKIDSESFFKASGIRGMGRALTVAVPIIGGAVAWYIASQIVFGALTNISEEFTKLPEEQQRIIAAIVGGGVAIVVAYMIWRWVRK